MRLIKVCNIWKTYARLHSPHNVNAVIVTRREMQRYIHPVIAEFTGYESYRLLFGIATTLYALHLIAKLKQRLLVACWFAQG